MVQAVLRIGRYQAEETHDRTVEDLVVVNPNSEVSTRIQKLNAPSIKKGIIIIKIGGEMKTKS